MCRQHVVPQTQNERTSSLIRGAKRLTGARIATFGVSVLMAGHFATQRSTGSRNA